jgi:hypothetical protein
MKYKTACRLAVRLIGLFFLVEGLTNVPQLLAGIWQIFVNSAGGGVAPYYAFVLLSPAVNFLIGGYLFAGGDRIVNYLIPSNRPYCHECGYELTLPASKHCPECGTEHNRPTPPV